MVFDYTLYDDTKKKSFRKGIIVVQISDNEEVTIGRTQSNTIKLKDISVSRMHCFFVKKDNKIYVSDKGSKFGTLLYMNKPFTLTNSQPNSKTLLSCTSPLINNFYGESISLVSGKNYFTFKLTKSWNIFANLFTSALCCKCKNNNEDEYVINIDDLNNMNNDVEHEVTKIKEFVGNHLNDSYCDYVINLDTIIKHNESIVYNNNNNNNSFI